MFHLFFFFLVYFSRCFSTSCSSQHFLGDRSWITFCILQSIRVPVSNILIFICEWNLHCAALIPEAVTKPMSVSVCMGGFLIWNWCVWAKLFEKVLKKPCSMVKLISLSGICLRLYRFYNRRNVNFSCTYQLMKGLTSYFVILFCQIILFTNIWSSFKPMCLIFFNRGPSRVKKKGQFVKTRVKIKTSRCIHFQEGLLARWGWICMQGEI